MFTLIFHVDDDICESYEGVVRFVEFVIPRIDSPELFDKPEVTLHNISTLVQLFVTSDCATGGVAAIDHVFANFLPFSFRIQFC